LLSIFEEWIMKNALKRFDILFAIIIFLAAIPAEYYEWFSSMEDQLEALRHNLRFSYGDQAKSKFPSDKIVIVAQTDSYMEEYGSYPPKWEDYGIMVENLNKLGAKVIMVDFLFEFKNSYGEDEVLANYLKKADNTIFVSTINFTDISATKINKIRHPVESLKKYTKTAYSNHLIQGSLLNGVRLYPDVIKKYGLWPISVKTVADYLGVQPQLDEKNRILIIGDLKIKLDQNFAFRTDFAYVPYDTYYLYRDPFVGIEGMDILKLDTEDEDEIEEMAPLVKDKIVFIGETSEIAHDQMDTLIGEVWGVEVLAMEVATLLKGAPLQSASTFAEIIVLLLIGFLLIGSNLLPDPKFRALASIGSLILYFAFCVLAYTYWDLVFSMSYVIVAGTFGFAAINIYLFIEERQQRSFIENAFGQYLSPDVIEALVEDPDRLSLGGERREMTAYFSDIQGFSTISESLTPDELVQLLNLYLTAMCDIISEHNGTIDKFEGDAIIAFWGAPLDQPDHATRSCLATIDMQKALTELRQEWMKEGYPMVLTRMGVNSGPMVVGNMGSQTRMDYTIMGDAVNLAARLEGANKFYKNFSMISDSTYDQAKDAVDVRELDTMRVVGKNEPITVYDLLDRKGQTSGPKADVVAQYLKGLDLYKQRSYTDAIAEFEKALAIDPKDGPSITYVNRCNTFLENPPEDDWDGVYTHTEKG